MKTVICLEPGRLDIIDRPVLAGPPKGWARLAVSHVGICGTDYHIFEGKHPYLEYPRVMGHEISARVIESGEGVSLAPGTPVIVNPYLSCGTCVACRKDKPNCCTAIKVLGVHTDGAFCEEILVPEENLYPAGDLTLEAAATVEFLAIGAHAVRRSLAPAGSRALVIGAGPIGLGTALFSRIAGHEVTLLDASVERLDMAADRLGFARGILAGDGALDAVLAATGGDGFDVVFDATGFGGSMEMSFAFVAHGGCLVFVSVVKDEIRFSDPEFHKREMMLVGSRNATRQDFEHVAASIRAGHVPVEALITHRTTLDEVVNDLPRWAHEKGGLIKAVVKSVALTRIDAHQHYWTLSLGHNDWPPPELAAIYRDFMPDDLRPHLAAAGITKTVLVQAAPNLAETAFLLGLAEREETVAAVVGWVDVWSPTARSDLELFKRHPKFRGVRPMLQGIEDTFCVLQPEAIRTLETLPHLGLRFDALIQPRHLPVISALADRLPDLPIVIDHAAKPFIAAGTLEPWCADMTALSRRSNVSVKLSGLVTEAGNGWTVERLRPYVLHLVDVFGPERMMFGSDWPVVDLDANYEKWWIAANELLQDLDESARKAVFGTSAARFYGIDS